MTDQNILCPRCQTLVYDGPGAPADGSILECAKCDFTLYIPIDASTYNSDSPKPPPIPPPVSTIGGPPAGFAATVEEAPSQSTTRESFKFTGTASEYFKIWIVNIALTILTLGIYSAWAKVRNNRYFYGNTRLMGSAFDYHAEPGRILIGRLIVFGLFVAHNFAASYLPIASMVLTIVFALVIPWLAIKSMQFRARNSSYRNIRFNFKSDYGEALMTYVGYGLLALVTLGIAYPHFVYKRKEFAIKHSRYGNTHFKFSATSWGFYKIYLLGVAIAIPIIFIFFSFGAFLGAGISQIPGATLLGPLLGSLPILAAYLIIYSYIKISVENLSLSNSSIGKSRLESNMEFGEIFLIHFTNIFAIIFTLGLMTPWAKIRMKKYKVEHLHLHTGEDFEEFMAGERQDSSALGEEAVDFFDFDIGL